VNYGATYPVYAKIDVKGPTAHPLFQYLTNQKRGVLGGSVKWNFTKFLVNRKGEVVKRYAPTTKPDALQRDIESLL
jgi:glutathione peroxidase